MCSLDYDPPDFWTERLVRAAKPHRCGECDRVIEPSETYWRATSKYDGAIGTYKTCVHCRVGHDWLSINCGGFSYHGLDEEMAEHVDEYPELGNGLLRIQVGLRRKWRRFDQAGLMPIPPLPRSIKSLVAEPAGAPA